MARTVRISGASPPRRRRSARGRTFSWSAGRSQRPEILDGRLPGFWKTFVQHAEGCDQDMLTREQLLAIFCKTKALQRGHFELSSGLHSGHYFQCAQFLQHPRLAARVRGRGHDRWGEMMARLDPDPLVPPTPENIEWSWIDSATGLRADGNCQGAVELPFIRGSAPMETAPCAAHSPARSLKNWFERLFE